MGNYPKRGLNGTFQRFRWRRGSRRFRRSSLTIDEKRFKECIDFYLDPQIPQISTYSREIFA